MPSSCELLDAELALDRVEAELARELPPHVRAFAEAYAAGRPEPAAPAILRQASTLAAGRRAWPHPLLAERALALLRLVVPVALGGDSLAAYPALVAARDAAAQRLFGRGAIAVVHALHGRRTPPADAAVPPPVTGWRDPDGVVLEPERAWRELAARHGVEVAVRFVATARRARTFVVGPGACIVAIPPRADSPAARFAVRHELGHALAAALTPAGVPRALDEAIAALVAIDPAPVAVAARARRLALTRHLDAVECGLAPAPADVPWSLVHDPGAQAAYLEAEHLADELAAAPDLRAAVAAWRAEIDRVATIDV